MSSVRGHFNESNKENSYVCKLCQKMFAAQATGTTADSIQDSIRI